ncbi:hypothetical protein B0H16DRAFT_1701734 [Mycena metata]|uniref:Uncharacterized protein n=1 Tax=Mycena metata TaxID=1033252 RepID=A0AAD7MGJ1_9AGAR|nr:hypothetical protein B0H16DRAFT_1701734 [Mycena metata]
MAVALGTESAATTAAAADDEDGGEGGGEGGEAHPRAQGDVYPRAQGEQDNSELVRLLRSMSLKQDKLTQEVERLGKQNEHLESIIAKQSESTSSDRGNPPSRGTLLRKKKAGKRNGRHVAIPASSEDADSEPELNNYPFSTQGGGGGARKKK